MPRRRTCLECHNKTNCTAPFDKHIGSGNHNKGICSHCGRHKVNIVMCASVLQVSAEEALKIAGDIWKEPLK